MKPETGQPPLPRRRRLLYGALAAVLVSAFLLLSLEGVLRALRFEYTPLRIRLLNRTDWRVDHAFQNDNFIYDSALIWLPRPNRSVFNEQGLRGPVLAPEKKPGEFRILALGDSNTLGWDGPEGPNWPLYLGAMLRESNPEIVLVNAGVWGYSSYQGLQRFRQCLVYQPDLVLWSFGANDAHRVGVPDRAFATAGVRQHRLDQRLMRSRTGQLLLKALDSLAAARGVGDPVPRVSVEEFRANLDEVIRTCRELGIGLVVLTRPFVGRSPSETWWKTHAPAYNQAALAAAAEAGVPVADVHAWFKDHREMFSDESHFTEAGHRRAAALLLEVIQKHWPALAHP